MSKKTIDLNYVVGSESSSFTVDDEFLEELWSICNNDDPLTNAVMLMDRDVIPNTDVEEGSDYRHH